MPQRLSIEVVDTDPSRRTVVIAGEIDMSTASELYERLVAHTDGDITVDLEAVTFLDSAGISALVKVHNILQTKGFGLRTTGEQDNVRAVFETVGLAEVFHPDGDEPTSAP